ncbi:CaiB/BaiF CoA transferase family protein [Brevibacterium atlanticum]|uniref:CaiB/BaiF CoA transferase family protein n=1 Tax=Brevibacterium atlanticum TaxID=2697563 RepID=UPI00141DCC2D|nr:CaiB/BaiF CoA-transferase family protein [Brevibacterium atlanticum]
MTIPRRPLSELPLSDLRIVELAGIGPGPHAAMLLADHGAQIIRIERATSATATQPGETAAQPAWDVSIRGRRVVRADLKDADDLARVRSLIGGADVLIEGFRPGVTERLGLGPEEMLSLNPRLIYGRMTGWGQDGPEAHAAGHDLNYIARTGLLHLIGNDGERGPVPPLNLVGDFGGGSMFLVLGILLALHERERTGHGQVVDAAIVDGAAALGASIWGKIGTGGFRDERGANFLDGSAPYYRCYACRDGLYLSVAAIERRFFDIVTDTLGLEPWPETVRLDPAQWPQIAEVLSEAFAGRTRAEWLEVFAGTDACIAPVRTMTEAPADEQMAARDVYVDIDGTVQPRPAPRLSNHGPLAPPRMPTEVEDLEAVIRDWDL